MALDPDPPLVDLKVTNPVTYFKKWWSKIIGNEGIDFRLHFHPLTAIAVSLAIASVGFGVGRFTMPIALPFFKYEEINDQPTQLLNTKDTAFIGTLHYSDTTKRFYLVTTSSEAINLSVPDSIDLTSLVGKRILAAGIYEKTNRLLEVADAKDLEVLPKNPTPVPTTATIVQPTPNQPDYSQYEPPAYPGDPTPP